MGTRLALAIIGTKALINKGRLGWTTRLLADRRTPTETNSRLFSKPTAISREQTNGPLPLGLCENLIQGVIPSGARNLALKVESAALRYDRAWGGSLQWDLESPYQFQFHSELRRWHRHRAATALGLATGAQRLRRRPTQRFYWNQPQHCSQRGVSFQVQVRVKVWNNPCADCLSSPPTQVAQALLPVARGERNCATSTGKNACGLARTARSGCRTTIGEDSSCIDEVS